MHVSGTPESQLKTPTLSGQSPADQAVHSPSKPNPARSARRARDTTNDTQQLI